MNNKGADQTLADAQAGQRLCCSHPPKDRFSRVEAHMITDHSLFVGLMLYLPVNRYGHVGTVSSPNNTFFLGNLEQAVNQYFVHILSLVTDNNPS